MQEDFPDAHDRHWTDAQILFDKQHWANADHLYGISAECGLKALMEKLKQGPLDKSDRMHVMEDKKPSNAWQRYNFYLSGHALATKLPLPLSNPFSDWLVSQRYANQSHFDQTRAESHQAGAQIIRHLIAKARHERLLT